MIIGIDPGQTGALAVIDKGLIVKIIDMPTMARTHGKGQQVDPYTLASELFEIGVGNIEKVVLEQVDGRPRRKPNGQEVSIGSNSAFNFGDSFGAIRGVLGALQVPLEMVTPQRWKKAAGLIGKGKDAARTLAIQLHPEIADQLTRKMDSGRADAVCIAHFG